MSGKVFASVQKTDSKLDALEKGLQRMRKTVIYVGIAKGSDQEYRKGQPISNCDLGFVHEFGSPANRIPPRPFLVPGVKSAKAQIQPRMQKAAKAALDGDEKAFDRLMEQTAIKAQVAVPNYVREHNGEFVPLKPRTIQARLRKNERVAGAYDRIRQKRGLDQKNIGNASSITTLMDTGQLVGAVRGVVVKDK